jgi:predicted HicB family RNase H-like nuclease
MMRYKGYAGQAFYDADAKLFHGEVIGLKDVITFQGTTVEEIEKAFKDSIDDYIEFCKTRGEKPEKPYSGNLHIRLKPELHAKLAQEALLHNQSLNSFIAEKLKK